MKATSQPKMKEAIMPLDNRRIVAICEGLYGGKFCACGRLHVRPCEEIEKLAERKGTVDEIVAQELSRIERNRMRD